MLSQYTKVFLYFNKTTKDFPTLIEKCVFPESLKVTLILKLKWIPVTRFSKTNQIVTFCISKMNILATVICFY